jgi:hypothetical protein
MWDTGLLSLEGIVMLALLGLNALQWIGVVVLIGLIVVWMQIRKRQ